ncbi:MAG: DUF6338 family protein [Candidatus Limnocylindria bacterium]
MPLSADSFFLFILFVLPGSVLQLRSERNAPVVREKRSAFRELTEALLYSILITFPAVITAYAIARLFVPSNLDLLLEKGLAEFTRLHPARALTWLACYALLTNGVAALAGAYDVPLRTKKALLRRLEQLGNARPRLRWLRYDTSLYDESVWWLALQLLPEEIGRPDVLVNARLKGGTRYVGKLRLLPIDRADIQSKDFAIHRASRIDKDGKRIELEPDDVVLLNFVECESVECHYYDEKLQPPEGTASPPPIQGPATAPVPATSD